MIILNTNSSEVSLEPRANTFASLCCLDNFACSIEVQRAALIPFILFAEIDIPIPDPQMIIPLCDYPLETEKPTK